MRQLASAPWLLCTFYVVYFATVVAHHDSVHRIKPFFLVRGLRSLDNAVRLLTHDFILQCQHGHGLSDHTQPANDGVRTHCI